MNTASKWSIKGFTLIEVVIVLLLISLIAGLVIPGIVRSMQKSELNQVGKNLVAAIRYTRAQALIKNKEQRITFDLDNNTYLVPEKETTVHLPETLAVKVLTAESEVDKNNISGIRFFPDGSSTGGRITLTGDDKTWIVNVAWLTGDIELVRQQHD